MIAAGPTAEVVLVSDGQAAVDALLGNAERAVQLAWDREILPFANDVRQKWPRRTGYSAGRLQSSFDHIGDTVRWSIFNDAEYAPFIVVAKWGSVNAAKTLLYNPADKLGNRLVLLIGAALTEGF